MDKLISLGHKVTVVDSGFAGDLGEVAHKVDLIADNFNCFTVADWHNIVDGKTYVFHLAAQKHNTLDVTSEEMIHTNVNSTHDLAIACAESGVKKLIFTSSLYSYGNLGNKIMKESDIPMPDTLYGSTKLMGENILRSISRKINLQWNIARLFFIYGPNQFAGSGYKSVIFKNFERIRDGLSPIINGSGTQALDYVFVLDAVEALIKLATIESSGNIVNISSSLPFSVNSLTNEMLKVAKSELSPIRGEADWTEGTIRFGDNNLAKETLKWETSVSLSKGLGLTWNSINSKKF